MGPLAGPLCCSRYDGACKILALCVGRADHCPDGSAAEQNRRRAEGKKAELNSSAVVLAVCVSAAGHTDANGRPQTILCSPFLSEPPDGLS